MKSADESLLLNLKRIIGVLLAWGIVGGLVCLAIWELVKLEEPMLLEKRAREEKLHYLFYVSSNKSDPRTNELYLNGNYEGLVDWMEAEFDRYDQYIVDLGGLDEVVRKSGRSYRGLACGFCELYCGLDYCVDYNAQFIPRDVEVFLMLVHQDTIPYTPELVRLFEAISDSNHPILKAYGLWFLKQAECKEIQVWDADDMEAGKSYPRIDAFRDYAYECANRGEAWAYGFAMDASRYDADRARAIDALMRYDDAISGKSVTGRHRELMLWWISSYTKKSSDQFDRLSAKQKTFIHQLLNDEIRHVWPYGGEEIIRLFEVMGRAADARAYEERCRTNAIISALLPHHVPLKDYRDEMHMIKPLMEKHAGEMHLVERAMDQYLESGKFSGFSKEQMRYIFRLMKRESDFDAAFPNEGKFD